MNNYTCRTCRRFTYCAEASRMYPCRDYKRSKQAYNKPAKAKTERKIKNVRRNKKGMYNA